MQSGLFVCLLVGVVIGAQAYPNEGYYHLNTKHVFNPTDENIHTPRYDVVESLNEVINEIARSISETADNLDGQVNEDFEPILPELLNTLDDGNNALAALSEEFEVDIQKRNGNNVCIDELKEKVRAILATGRDEIRHCVQTSANQVAQLRAKVQNSLDAIRNEVQAIRNVVAKCRESDGPVKCILQNLKHLVASAGKIVLEAIGTAIETRRTVRAIVVENLQCVTLTVFKAREAIVIAQLEAVACIEA